MVKLWYGRGRDVAHAKIFNLLGVSENVTLSNT